MRLRWYGQSAFLFDGSRRVFVDPFGNGMAEGAAAHGMQFDYPQIGLVDADLLLVTHEHADHNGVEAVNAGTTLRSTAGTHESPIGTVVGIASEHDAVAGTERGPNTIFRFELDGLRICHFGDFGQASLRPEQAAAIDEIDVLIMPAGDGPTVGGKVAAAIARSLRPRLIVPMHYRTAALNFLEPADAFLEALALETGTLDVSTFEVEELLGSHDQPTVAVPAPPS